MEKNKTVFIGNFLDKYTEIEKYDDCGGNATVYKVNDEYGNIYAIKLLWKEISKEKMKRFKNEMTFGMQNKNDNIISILDNGRINVIDKKGISNEYMFYVMKFYPKNLRKLIKEGINEDKVLYYFNNICEGIKYIHNRKMYHRDLKPENILFDEIKDNLLVADFGIAHFSEKIFNLLETKVTSKLANFPYASPEQREREAVVDYRTDIYSLGLILHEMFTSRIPIGTNYTKISEVTSKYSFLDPVIEKMLEQNLDRRFQRIEDIQFEINIRMEIYQKDQEIKRLKQIEIQEAEEKDILILDPVKIIDVKYFENTNVLNIVLDKKVNSIWIDSISMGTCPSYSGCSHHYFNFNENVASITINPSNISIIPGIVEHFKVWINNANKYYPEKINETRRINKINYEREIKNKIQNEEKLKEILSKVKI